MADAYTTKYSALGMAAISYPVDRVKHACAAKLGAGIMQRLARGKAPNIQMTAWAKDEFMRDKVRLFIGDVMVVGRPVKRHDILDALYSTNQTGKTLEAGLRESISNLRNIVGSKSYVGKNMSLSQFL